MLPLGHVGIPCAIVHRLDPKADLRLVALAGLLPDLVDKPLSLVVPGFANGWTRLGAHSLVGLAVFALIAGVRLRRAAWAAVLAYALHLGLDRMWEAPPIFLWPFLGFWPPPNLIPYVERLFAKLTNPWTLGGEAAGLAAIVWLWRLGGLSDRARRGAFYGTGVIERAASAREAPKSGEPPAG